MRQHAFKTGLRVHASTCNGSLLIEVMLAVALVAVSALGLIAVQVWIAREARAMTLRESAAWIADSIAEATRTPSTGDVALNQWRTWASVLLPHGDASIGESGAVAAARVTWASVRDRPALGDASAQPAEPCGDVDAPAGSSCVALAFAK
ncbi:type IV pilus modification PilV family protein [Paraburkholderia sp. MM6662-R1]|uniref:type IV pilus modification PilV family protein n=1 Tax=Paraburkholderia sp. MM6662-R1 TaxID=2991066 RepID=UPI003D199663